MCADRRSFVKTACLAGLCGWVGENTAAASGEVRAQPEAPTAAALAQKWIATLLPVLATGDREHAKRALKRCSKAHYDDLNMQVTVDRFRGHLDEFLAFLRQAWAWIIDYHRDRGIIEVNENKRTCVCPLVQKGHGADLGLLCYCSEGFAETMFSEVFGSPVRAEVTESILRGHKSCKYRIELKPSRP